MVSLGSRFIGQFEPFMFIYVMGTGISSDILYRFPYYGRWLRVCSYIMFALACLIFVSLQVLCVVHLWHYTRRHSFSAYVDEFVRNTRKSVFWGTYPMGLVTIINYLFNLTQIGSISQGDSRRLMIFVYALWWYDIAVSIVIAWGLSFVMWHKYYFPEGLGKGEKGHEKVAAEYLKSTLLLAVIPLVVAASSSSIWVMSGLFGRTFNRNIQLLTMVITVLIWLHAILFVAVLVFIYFWSLYLFKIPPMAQVFTLFLVLGPMGQGAFGILLVSDNVLLYTQQYYPVPGAASGGTLSTAEDVLLLAVPWCFKVLGLIYALALLAVGYFFTIICIIAMLSYRKHKEINAAGKPRRIYNFHTGFWGMTFPMGTMSLGSDEVYIQYNKYVPMRAFRVVSAIYGTTCILWTIFCVVNTVFLYGRRGFRTVRAKRDHRETESKAPSPFTPSTLAPSIVSSLASPDASSASTLHQESIEELC
ncbi:Ssu1p KNAG_0A01800 [Huiozyma naganishii CBS 8797]|uniref:Sulfite efflux pump SSU1 n=1 Tax=Huiozyma naganishii (strain ATCC MYA-139 / BCRC 22969 / CBS 8797 / KCTC 17520 / NBRC 10181 / NCYC 3082 / Yp74L-3) TaxID=1071383 RepID=J7S1W8_HUIN7|nr:hypothetical protein KNAG_0A01800 [Kazachstania naganishii CBS 8797]CCK67869.1 hypothetical protein KNAG_0A01800 [Kazachstania naganishii CBS 8797]